MRARAPDLLADLLVQGCVAALVLSLLRWLDRDAARVLRSGPAVLAATGVALLAAVPGAALDDAVPEPYMDEIFHVPQAQRYCAGDLATWDPMITTPPATYLAALPLAAARAVARHAAAHALAATAALARGAAPPSLAGALDLGPPLRHACSASALRAASAALAAPCFLTLCFLVRLESRKAAGRATHAALAAHAASLALLPTHFFFHWLFYTDTGATLALLLAFAAARCRAPFAAGLLGAVAVLYRQTNAVWFCLALAELVLGRLPRAAALRVESTLAVALQPLRDAVSALRAAPELLRAGVWFPALVPAAFAAFVAANGGVTLGDRAAHAPVAHLAQPLYAALFTCAALAPGVLAALPRTCRPKPRHVVIAALAVAAAAAAVHRGTYAHPYLLADNRHYSFYVWRRVLSHRLARFALVPAYVAAGWALHVVRRPPRHLGSSSVTWCWVFYLCLVAALVPAGLLEPRYFTVPTLLTAVQLRVPPARAALLAAAAFAAVNAATWNLFVHRPFRAPDGTTGRFMY